MDGLLYAAISNNMANGYGSFWKPYLSESVFNEFYEHPPLALWLQSIWFRVFGDSIYIERFYSLFTYFISGGLLVIIWKQIGQSFKTGWIPLFLWLTITNISWACANNMLENTMTIFVLLSVWATIKAIKGNKNSLFFLSGIFLSLALLSKGFVCLYVWIIPLGWHLFFKSKTLIASIRNTILLIVSTALPIALLYFFSREAAHNMTSYFESQVMRSVKSVAIVDSRFSIFFDFFQSIIPPITITLIIVLASIKQTDFLFKIRQNKKLIYLFSLLVFCGIAPIMISLKQRGFYILTVYPFVGLVLGLITLPLIKKRLEAFSTNGAKTLKVFSIILFVGAIFFASFQFNKIGREKNEILDAYQVINYVGEEVKINICSSEYGKFSKHGYYARYGRVTLSRKYNLDWSYFLVHKKECIPDSSIFELTPINLIDHDLYKRK